jgi:hypothetical protein
VPRRVSLVVPWSREASGRALFAELSLLISGGAQRSLPRSQDADEGRAPVSSS